MLHAQPGSKHRYPGRIATFAIALVAAALLPLADAAADSATLNRIKTAGKMTLGYLDARPFAYRDEAGSAAGYAVDLCKRVADEVKGELGLAAFAVEWVPVTLENRVPAVREGKVDLLCGDTVTLAARRDVAFSTPIFPDGIGAMLRSDASSQLKDVLSKGRHVGTFWRGSPSQILEKQRFSVVKGSRSEQWLASRLDTLQIDATVVPVESFDAGVRRVLDRATDVFFAARAILLDAEKRNPSARSLVVLDRHFTVEPVALALARGDEDFRFLVDRTLSRLFASDGFPGLYAKWFGAPDDYARTFFQMNTMAE